MNLHNDFAYELTPDDVHHSRQVKACRNAVLWRLLPRADRLYTPAATVEAMATLRRMWYARLWKLQDAGWAPARVGPEGEPRRYSRMQFLRNCPPFGVAYNRTARCCHRIRVCPFCFAREIVGEAYAAMHYAMHRPDCPPARLLALRVEVTLPIREPAVVAARVTEAAKSLSKFHASIASTLDNPRRVMGSRIFASVSPHPSTANVLLVQQACLMLVREGQPPPASLNTEQKNKKTQVRYTPATDDSLLNHVGWCMAYPVGMLRGDAAVARMILDTATASKLRMQQATGVCNNACFRSWQQADPSGNVQRKTAGPSEDATPAVENQPDVEQISQEDYVRFRQT